MRDRALRWIEAALRLFDNEKREWVVRFRIWRGDRYGYHTTQLLGIDDDDEPVWGERRWHPPKRGCGR